MLPTQRFSVAATSPIRAHPNAVAPCPGAWEGAPMPADYGPGARALQDHFDTRRLADRLDERFFTAVELTPERKALIERLPFFFLATADEHGQPQCSYKGGDPGFVRVLGRDELCFPNYDGNGMYLSIGNLA